MCKWRGAIWSVLSRCDQRSNREAMWQREKHTIARRIVTVDDHLKAGYVAYPDLSANRFLEDLISVVDQRSYNDWDKNRRSASESSDRDPTARIWYVFIMYATWHYLGGPSAILRSWLNYNNSHPRRFIWAIDRRWIVDQKVTPKLACKLRCSSTMKDIREQFEEI